MRDDPSVVTLVERARANDRQAWSTIVERYAPLVWAICRRYRLSDADADDIAATVWLRLVENLDTIRQPAALPGWLVRTTGHECTRALRSMARVVPLDDHQPVPEEASRSAESWLLVEERRLVLRTAFGGIPLNCQQLLSMLFHDPPIPYAVIGAELDMKIGAIGPTRKRCLDKLRQHPALAAFLDS
ncbi:MAG TPA: sigma-70 family RNA polymerase sigma factor [Mycobacteriales bacterium]|nr:sigma-70 family RNA polymerase sigma factor [Mycobacteriales bacterium]